MSAKCRSSWLGLNVFTQDPLYRLWVWSAVTDPHSVVQTLAYISLRVSWRGLSPYTTSFTWWHHRMETFSALLAFCAGISPVSVNSPHKGQWRGALMFSLICAPINDWVNNREAGDLRRYRCHYEVIVMNVKPALWYHMRNRSAHMIWDQLCGVFCGIHTHHQRNISGYFKSATRALCFIQISSTLLYQKLCYLFF